MKKILQKPLTKKILIIFTGLILLVLLLDNLILPWYVNSPEKVVPSVVGKFESEAIEILENAGFQPIVSDTPFDEKFPKGAVILQKPSAGKEVKEGRRVYIFISGGEPVINVPRLIGRSVRDAKLTLERLGLKLGTVNDLPSNQPKDMIFDQQYAEGTPLKRGQTVNVSVSLGDGLGEIEVPDLIGKSLSDAQRILAELELRVGKINYQHSFSLLPNTILDQYPSKGNRLNSGDRVDLFVTKAAEPLQDDQLREE